MFGSTRDPLSPTAARRAAWAVALVLFAALVGAAVRILPWILDPTLAWGTLAPFAKSLLWVAVEVAVLTGWPVGWALAAQQLVERGEARVLVSLGESPWRSLARLIPQAVFFSAVLVSTSLAMGREATAPGRVVEALLAEGRASCLSPEAVAAHETRSVPFVSATWLCSEAVPRLVGRAPFGGVVFTASDAHVTDDLRRIDLEGARLVLGARDAAGPHANVRVATLTLKGMTPWARASSLPPSLRAVVVGLSGLVAACVVVVALLSRYHKRIGVVAAAAVGAAGPLAALGVLRWLELRVPTENPGKWLIAFGLVPLAAWLAATAAARLAHRVRASSTLRRRA